jgi:hypothetical protein
MALREISEDDLWAALDRPNGHPAATATGNIWVYGYATGGRILKVLLTPDKMTIVTAAWPDE